MNAQKQQIAVSVATALVTALWDAPIVTQEVVDTAMAPMLHDPEVIGATFGALAMIVKLYADTLAEASGLAALDTWQHIATQIAANFEAGQ